MAIIFVEASIRIDTGGAACLAVEAVAPKYYYSEFFSKPYVNYDDYKKISVQF